MSAAKTMAWLENLSMAPQDYPGLHYLNPDVPGAVLLPSPLRVGTKISILAKIPSDGRRFYFEFQKGDKGGSSNIALVFDPNLDDKYKIVRNSCLNNVWGQPEIDMPGEFPFHSNQNFRMDIEITKECYETKLDGKPLFKFKHRCPIDLPTHLRITGAIKITNLSFLDPLPPTTIITLPNSYNVGDTYTINGHPTKADADIKVAVQASDTNDDLVLLMVNPRLDTGEVVLSSRLKREWGNEEIPADIPFANGKRFMMVISVLEDRFKIVVDGKKLAEYRHRSGLVDAHFLTIKGDVSLYKVLVSSQADTGPSVGIIEPLIDKTDKNIDPVIDTYNPLKLPATFTIRPDGFLKSKKIRIKGHIPNWTTKLDGFQISLKDKATSDSAILMHMNVRIDDAPHNTVTRNALLEDHAAYENSEELKRQPKNWGHNERHLAGNFPFRKGDYFDIEMYNEDGVTHVKVNGQDAFIYARRVYHTRFAHFIHIDGMVEINKVEFP